MKNHLHISEAGKTSGLYFGSLALLIAVLSIMAAYDVAAAISTGTPVVDAILGGSGLIAITPFAMIGNVDDVSDREVAGKQLGYTIYLAHISQIENKGFPTPNKARELGPIPFKPYERLAVFHAHVNPNSNSTGEKGDLVTANTNTVDFIMGGNPDVLLNFIEEHAGDKFLLFYKECANRTVYELGTPCDPMILQSYERNNNNDRKAITFTFQNNSFRQPVKYVGNLPITNPAVNPNNDRLVLKPGVDTYMIVNENGDDVIDKIEGYTPDDLGRYITLIGAYSGNESAGPINDEASFMLVDGVSWYGSQGSRLCLQLIGAGRAVEIPGTRIQL